MNENIKCPFCQATVGSSNYFQNRVFLNGERIVSTAPRMSGYSADFSPKYTEKEVMYVNYIKCPYCDKISCNVYDETRGRTVNIYPISVSRDLPEYIPKEIVADYKEAYDILNISPRASATLSRRCLQGMIRDFWGIKNKRNLKDEIIGIPKDKISEQEKLALHALREMGNIGAHPENTGVIVDIEPGEAETLLTFIEILIDRWYVTRHKFDETTLLVKEIDEKKQELRKQTTNHSNNTVISSENFIIGDGSSVNVNKRDGRKSQKKK